MSVADDTPWREAMRVPRLGNLDARAFYAFLLFLFYWSWWTLGLCILVVVLLWIVERFGMSVPRAFRALRSYWAGPVRSVKAGWQKHRMVDFHGR